MKKFEALPPGMAPRMLSRAAAAAYCGISANHFAANVPVAPVQIGGKTLWDRKALDTYLDRLSGIDVVEPGIPADEMRRLLEKL